jgi:hypothetical protein
MISLKEILHTIGEEKRNGLIPIESWRWPDVNHLATMGFGFDGDYYMQTDKHPVMKIYKKKETDEGEEEETEYYYLEEPKRKVKRFEQFNDLIDFFDAYEQPEIDKNM